ncbi:unnamed protein product, partial [Mesorhabditis belari]|uniref:Precorrin-2 dehydrogenase n=1 Tax=Mesorhabditis belari TaxID=2138241 RepID=A0AAF3F0C4_9BILA
MSSKVSVIFGSGRCAEHMARILFSTGERVAIVNGKPEFEGRIREKMKSDIQTAMPFIFPDDLRNQQELFESRLSRLQFAQDFSSIEGEVELIVHADNSSQQEILKARSLFPKTPIASLASLNSQEADQYMVELKLFEPLESNKIIEIRSQPKTQKVVLQKIRELLNKAGILEVNAIEAEKVNALIKAWQKNAQPVECLENDMETLLSSYPTDASARRHTVMH